LELTDYFPTLSTTIYSIGGSITSDGGSLWEQVKKRVKAFVPSKSIGCDLYGRLLVRADPMEEEPGVRTSNVNAALTMADVSDIRFTHTRSPGTHWLRGNALQAISPLPTDSNGDTYQPTFFAIAPGDVPGQGEIEETFGEHLSPSQTLLNTATGHHYARINARESLFDITLVGGDWQHLDPAPMEWVTITLDAAYAAQRGLSFTAARGLLHEVEFGYPVSATGTTRTCRIRWERETVGRPALTVTQPDVDPVDDGNDDWYTPPVVPVAPPADMPAGVEDVALLADDGGLFVTADFQTASASGGPTWVKTDLGTGALYTWVVDPFSPGYIAGTGAVNGWAVGQDDIWRITDIFGTPSATSVHTFADSAVAASYHWRTIQASFGRYFAEGSNPWLLCISYYGDTAGHTGTWATYSLDGGTTWADEVLVSAEYDSGLTAPNPIGVYASPKTPGLGYTAAFWDSASPAPADGYVTTDWGATWSRVGGTPIDDPAFPLPLWARIDDSGSGAADISYNGRYAHTASISATNTGATPLHDEWYILVCPPNDCVRIRLECHVDVFYHRDSLLSGADASFGLNQSLSSPPVVKDTDLAYSSPGYDTGFSQNFYVEWSISGTDWPGSRSDYEANPPLTFDDVNTGKFCRIHLDPSANSISVSSTGYSTINWNGTIIEIELADGTIYMPPVSGPGLIQPIHGQAGAIHLPWPSNDDELVAFYGALDRLTNREFDLMQSLTGTPSAVSPNDGTRDYGVNRPGFAVRTYDNDRTYAAFAGIGNDTSADPADDQYALFISDDGGATWTTIDGPDAAATPHATEIAFSSDDADVLIAWGTDGTILYSSDFGSTLDSRAGNIATANGGSAPDLLIGLAGGATG